jgi:hypothetical protein
MSLRPGFPSDATGPVCWGPHVAALATYLLVRQHLPVARCADLLGHVGANVSTGWVAGQVPKASGRLAGWLAALRDRLAARWGANYRIVGDPTVPVDHATIRWGRFVLTLPVRAPAPQ